MSSAALIGILAAGITVLPAVLQALPFNWYSPVWILAVTFFAVLLQRFFVDRRSGPRTYDGVADFLIHVHSPAMPDSSARWAARGVISFCFSLFGGIVGPEGPAAELAHAVALRIRAGSARWLEQRRRTDVASSLAAAIAAAFGAPMAGILVPIELGIGGRSLSSAVSAFTAFLGVRYLRGFFPKEAGIEYFDLSGVLYGFQYLTWEQWLGILVVAVIAGVSGVALIRFIRYCQASLLNLFQTQTWIRTLSAGFLIFMVAMIYRPAHHAAWQLLEHVLWSRIPPSEVGLFLATQVLTLALVIAGFGTVGIFWPLFALGGFLGFEVNHWVLRDIAGFPAIAALAGGVGIWASVLGIPLSATLLVFEMTQSTHVMIPCFLAAMIARKLRDWLRTPTLVDLDLEARGITLVEGREASVLDGISVKDAMVTDHEVVHEQEPVAELYSRMLKSRYPFLPVVSPLGIYRGLLTSDVVEGAWRKQGAIPATELPLAKLLEAKDLLYRSGLKAPIVKLSDPLSQTGRLFRDLPCVPVLGDDKRVVGLLFVYNVRLAYEREMIRRSLKSENREA